MRYRDATYRRRLICIMEERDVLPFPYEIEDFTPEEQEYVDKVFGSIVSVYRLSRIGPKGYVVYEPYKKDAANIYNMAIRSTDIFVASYQRSGTTITQELVWLLQNNLDYKMARTVPLKQRYSFLEYENVKDAQVGTRRSEKSNNNEPSFRFFMYFDGDQDAFIKSIDSNMDESDLKKMLAVFTQPASQNLATVPTTTPRFIKTHLPMSLLNPQLLETAKMVYVARDPRDVAVSCYHCAKLFKTIRFPGGFKEFWNLFYKDMYTYCPIFEHVKEAWDKRHHPNMLFMFYEDISKDLTASIRRVAEFLGKNLEPEDIERLREHLSIENFKNNKAVNHADLRTRGMLDTDESFIRRGKSGGWREYFDEEMTEQAEQWITTNLQYTDLRYPHF